MSNVIDSFLESNDEITWQYPDKGRPYYSFTFQGKSFHLSKLTYKNFDGVSVTLFNLFLVVGDLHSYLFLMSRSTAWAYPEYEDEMTLARYLVSPGNLTRLMTSLQRKLDRLNINPTL